jgi:hypothetical protein
MDWIQFSIFLGSMAGLSIWQRNDINSVRAEHAADRRDLLQISREIKDEIKDFHGRLERQDAEFKAHLLHIQKDK